MAKDPVLPLYYNDLTTSTQDWSDEEFGAYVRLLIHQWRQGGLPKDYQRLTRIATSLDRNWPMLKSKFIEVDDLLMNEYMELVRAKRVKHKQKQKENIEKRYQTSTKQSTKTIPLEIENEIEKEKENKEGVQGKPLPETLSDEWFASIFDEQTLENYGLSFRDKDVPEQYQKFKLKVRGDPSSYQHRDTGGMRNAFQHHLEHAKRKTEQNGNGRGASGTTSAQVAGTKYAGSKL